MSGTAMERKSVTDHAALNRLQESFNVFNRVSRDLERVYGRLESRAAAVESRLGEANRRLSEKVASLGREAEELQGVLETIPCGVVVCDPYGSITRVNPAAEHILGRAASELVGRGARTLRGSDGACTLLVGQDDVPVGVTVERRVTTLDGSMRVLSGSVAELPEGGRLEFFTDNTEVAHLRSQITRLDTLAALGEMAASVAHEIRNPMNGVAGFAGLLEKALAEPGEDSEERLRRYADRIRRGAEEVNGIITNLLTWARPDRMLFESVPLLDLLDEIRGEVRERYDANPRIEIGTALGGVHVRADRLKLKLAIGNLVRNAVEATEGRGRVVVDARRSTGDVMVSVDDDGPGIAAGVRGRLFAPFTTTKRTGTGLGLAIVRRLVDLHRGAVTHEESPLGGARFVVALPAGTGGAS